MHHKIDGQHAQSFPYCITVGKKSIQLPWTFVIVMDSINHVAFLCYAFELSHIVTVYILYFNSIKTELVVKSTHSIQC